MEVFRLAPAACRPRGNKCSGDAQKEGLGRCLFKDGEQITGQSAQGSGTLKVPNCSLLLTNPTHPILPLPAFLPLSYPFFHLQIALLLFPLNWIPLIFSFLNSPKQRKRFKNKLNSVEGYTVKSRVHLLYLHLFRNSAYAMAIKHGHKLSTPLSEWWSLCPSPWIWASFWVQQPT